MKKLEIVIKPERLELLKAILEEADATGVMISNVMGYGNQKGITALYRGTRYTVNFLPKVKVTTITDDLKARKADRSDLQPAGPGRSRRRQDFCH